MIEGLYDHVTEKNPGNNPTFLQFSKRVTTEAFYFVIPVVTSGCTMCQNASVRRTRVRCPPITLMLLYALAKRRPLRKQCEQCSNRDMSIASLLQEDLRKIKTNLEDGKDIDPALLRKHLYIGTMALCRGYVSMLGCKGNLTNDQKAKLRVFTWLPSPDPLKL